MPFLFLFFFQDPYNLNVGVLDLVPEVSETILSSFHSFYFILLFISYFHHFIFQLTDSFFCFRYSAIDSFQSIFGEGTGDPLQSSCLENPMDGGAWWTAVYGIAKSWTRLNDFSFTFHFHALEKEMATYSSILAWRIPGTGEPGGLPSMGSHRV